MSCELRDFGTIRNLDGLKMQAVTERLIPGLVESGTLVPASCWVDLPQVAAIARMRGLETLGQCDDGLFGDTTAELSLTPCTSYERVEIPDGATVYCDPPYAGTAKYLKDFDSATFFDWVRERSRTAKVFVSEYAAPADFRCVWAREKSCGLSLTARKSTVEKLFVYNG